MNQGPAGRGQSWRPHNKFGGGWQISRDRSAGCTKRRKDVSRRAVLLKPHVIHAHGSMHQQRSARQCLADRTHALVTQPFTMFLTVSANSLDAVNRMEMRMLEASTRALLGGSHGPEEEGEEEHHDDQSHDTKSLRIAALFIILAAGLAGGLPPLFMPKFFSSRNSLLAQFLRSMTSGIILALALIHILPESVFQLQELTQQMNPEYKYNVAGACAIFGIALMLLMESATHSFLESRARKAQAQPVAESAVVVAHSHAGVEEPHTHVCMGHVHPVPMLASSNASRRDLAMAYLFEAGCVFHSVIIGVEVGVSTDELKTVRALTIAIFFHQLLEGLALGAFIMRAHISKWKGISMVVIYSLTAPMGVAIGLGVAESYDEHSVAAVAVQGVFNGVAGGLLLYIALVQMVAEDFSRRELDLAEDVGCDAKGGADHLQVVVASQPLHRNLVLHGGFYAGCVAMAIIGLWA